MTDTQSEIELPDPLPPDGVPIPILATFVGLRGVPLLSLGHNSLRPIFRLYPDAIETRVYRKRRRPYSEIERVHVVTAPWTRNVEIDWRGSVLTFAANVRQEPWRRAVLRFLADRGAPLTPAARHLLPAATAPDGG